LDPKYEYSKFRISDITLGQYIKIVDGNFVCMERHDKWGRLFIVVGTKNNTLAEEVVHKVNHNLGDNIYGAPLDLMIKAVLGHSIDED
jgi:hypothetical protein